MASGGWIASEMYSIAHPRIVSEICISLLMSDVSLLSQTERSRFCCGPPNLQHTD
jgi:hypothetical protein